MKKLPTTLAAFGMTAAMLGSASGLVHATGLDDGFGTALACRIAERELADMPVQPVYRFSAEGARACIEVVPDVDAAGAFFADAACEISIEVTPTTLASWCDTLLDPVGLGEGEDLRALPVGAAAPWTLSPGSRLDVGARSLDGILQPWLQRSIYREVETVRGSCALEMRIYAASPAVSDQRSLVAFHGGSWSNRGFGFLGLELTVPHFVERGFVVYAPFYRLLGESEGSVACNAADFENDIVADAHAALDWVIENDERHGSGGAPVVFGQSAGGQLAARLAADRPDEISGAVLFYTPGDYEDFVLRAADGSYTNAQGVDILERVLGVPVDEADTSMSPIPENSIPQRIARDGLALPPVFMLHGIADTLVEARQSVRLCDALAGRDLPSSDQPLEPPTALREVLDCGTRNNATSSLHLVLQGQHALDVCIASASVPTDLCPAGSEASRALVADSIGSAVVFADAVANAQDAGDPFFPGEESGVDPDPGYGTSAGEPANDGEMASVTGAGSGGGGIGYPLLWLLAGAALRRRCRPRWIISRACGAAPSTSRPGAW